MLRKHKKLTKKELKQDPLVIFMAQAVEYFQTEWIKIVSTVLVIVLITTAAFLFVKGKKRSGINAYDAALSALNNNAPEAMDLMKKVVDKHKGSESADDATIAIGNTYFQKKDYTSAEKYYKMYIDNYSEDPVYTLNAYNGLAGAYEEQGNFLKAGEIYEQYTKKFKNSIFLPLMYLNAGKAYLQAGNKESARRNFMAVTENFKDSDVAQDAYFYLETLK